MNSTTEPQGEPSLLGPWSETIERFASALRAEEPVRIEDYLSGVPDTEREALRAHLESLARTDPAPPDGSTRSTSPDPTGEATAPRAGGDAPTLSVLESTPGTVAPGAWLGGYRVEEEIGRGAMGVVYRAWDPRVRRLVAMKLFRVSPREDRAVERTRREVEAAGRGDHRNVVPIYAADVAGGRYFLVMRLLRGGSLADRVRVAPLEGRPAARLMAEVARAIHFCHGRDIVHRDLKPSNILLDEEGVPYVGDFGLAKLLDADPELSLELALAGTIPYMSPDQARDPTRVGPGSDIYSLGATLYCLLTGRPPFQAATPLETLRQVHEVLPPPPRRINPAIARDLETICLKCLEKSPARRYDTAAALADDLDRFVRGEPILARRPSWPHRLARKARARPLVAALAASVLLLAGLCFALMAYLLVQAGRRRGEMERSSYFDRVALAAQALATDRPDVADRLLAQIRDRTPALCGWEWRALWRLKDEPPRDLPGAGVQVNAVAYRPGGSALVLAGRGGYLEVRDAATGRSLGRLGGLPAEIELTDVVWATPRGRPEFIAAAGEDATVRAWERRAGGWSPRALPRAHTHSVHALAVDPETGRLLSGGDDGRLVAWDWPSGAASRLATLRGQVWGVALSPDGRRYAATGGDRTVWVGRLDGGEPRAWGSHADTGLAVAFSPDGRRLASSSADGSIALWDAARPGRSRPIEGQVEGVFCLRFSPDGRRLASADRDHQLALWDVETGREALSLALDKLQAIAFSPDGGQLAAASRTGTVRIWDTRPAAPAPRAESVPLRGHDATIVTLAVTRDGRRVASAGNDGRVVLWDVARRRGVLLGGPRRPDLPKINAVAFRPDGLALAAGDRDGRVTLWDVEARRPQAIFSCSPLRVGALAYHPDGRRLATGDETGRVVLWETSPGPPVARPLGVYPSEIYALAFHPDGRSVAVGGAEGSIWLFDLEGRPPRRLTGHADRVEDLAFSPDGRLLASSGADRTVILWDAATGRERRRIRGHTSCVWGVAFSPDSRLLATAESDRVVRLYDAADGRRRGSLRGHDSRVCVVAFCPTGPLLASAGGDRTVRLWDVSPWIAPVP